MLTCARPSREPATSTRSIAAGTSNGTASVRVAVTTTGASTAGAAPGAACPHAHSGKVSGHSSTRRAGHAAFVPRRRARTNRPPTPFASDDIESPILVTTSPWGLFTAAL